MAVSQKIAKKKLKGNNMHLLLLVKHIYRIKLVLKCFFLEMTTTDSIVVS